MPPLVPPPLLLLLLLPLPRLPPLAALLSSHCCRLQLPAQRLRMEASSSVGL